MSKADGIYGERFGSSNFELLADEQIADGDELESIYAETNDLIEDVIDFKYKKPSQEEIESMLKSNQILRDSLDDQIYLLEIDGWEWTGVEDLSYTYSKGSRTIRLTDVDPMCWDLKSEISGFDSFMKVKEYCDMYPLIDTVNELSLDEESLDVLTASDRLDSIRAHAATKIGER